MRYTLKNIAILTVAFFLTAATFSTSFAANVEVEMLNKQDKEIEALANSKSLKED